VGVEGLLFSLAKIAAAVAVGLPLVVYLAQESPDLLSPTVARMRVARKLPRRFPAATEVTIAFHRRRKAAGLAGEAARRRTYAAVLYYGGNAEEVSHMLEAIGDPVRGDTPGVAWLIVNYRGYGASEGSPSQSVARRRCAGAIRLRLEASGHRHAAHIRLWPQLGSGVAVQLAAHRPLRGVILVSPYDSLAAVAKRYYWYLPVDWMLKHRFDSIALAPQMKRPLLCFIAERDDVIPPEHAERLFAAWAGPKRRVLLGGAWTQYDLMAPRVSGRRCVTFLASAPHD
jgi:fermentation-respiration switch protein FrsA (DUF1100 family)